MNIKKIFRISCLIFIILICALIFAMSAKQGEDSANISGSFIKILLSIFNWNFKNLPINEQQLIINSYQFFVRKAAHFSIFAALGFFTAGFLNTYINLRYLKAAIFSLSFVFLYAVSDEVHQLFTLDRSGQVSDVILDTCGGIFGIVLMSLIIRAVLKNLEERKRNEL